MTEIENIEIIKKAAEESLIKWRDPEANIGDDCGFCNHCYNCSVCLCPDILCNWNNSKSIMKAITKDSDVFSDKVKNVSKVLLELMLLALDDLAQTGKISDLVIDMIEDVI